MTSRYIVPIYATVIVIAIGLIDTGCKKILGKRKSQIAMIILLAIMTVNSWKLCDWQYLYRDSEKLLDKAEEYTEQNNIYIYDDVWKIQPSFYEISKYKSATFFHKDNIEAIAKIAARNDENIVVTIINSCDVESILNRICELCPLVDSYEKIGGYSYATSYYLYGQNCKVNQCRIYDYNHSKLLGCKYNAAMEENICMTVQDTLVKEVSYSDSEYVNLWIDDWVLDINNAKFANETNIRLWVYNATNAQDWKVQENDDGTVTFLCQNEHFAMARDKDGNVCLADYIDGDASQKWWIEN